MSGLLDGARFLPEKFAGTTVAVPGLQPGEKLRDVLTGEEREVRDAGLAAEELFSTLPVALLVRG